MRLLQAAGQEVCFTHSEHRLNAPERGVLRYDHLFEQGQGLGDPPGQRIGQAQAGEDPGQEEWNVGGTALGQGTFKYGHGVLEVTLAQGKRAQPVLRKDGAAGVRRLLGNADGFFDVGPPLRKLPKLCQTAR